MIDFKRYLTIPTFVAAVLTVTGISAANAGKLLGRYVYTSTESCQITFVIRRNPTSGNITSIDGNPTYVPMRGEAGFARFTSSNGGVSGLATVIAKGFEGDSVRVQDGNRTSGKPIKRVATKFTNEPFTASGNKLTIAGFTFQAVYGETDPSGIAQSVHLIRKEGACIQQIAVTR